MQLNAPFPRLSKSWVLAQCLRLLLDTTQTHGKLNRCLAANGCLLTQQEENGFPTRKTAVIGVIGTFEARMARMEDHGHLNLISPGTVKRDHPMAIKALLTPVAMRLLGSRQVLAIVLFLARLGDLEALAEVIQEVIRSLQYLPPEYRCRHRLRCLCFRVFQYRYGRIPVRYWTAGKQIFAFA